MPTNPIKDITQIFLERTEIDKALTLAVQDTLWKHKQLGFPIVVWRDGKVVWIPPEEIQVEAPTTKPPAPID